MNKDLAEALAPDVLTVGDLVDALVRCPRHLPVVVTWEGIYRRVSMVQDPASEVMLVVVLDGDAGDPFE